MKYFFIPLILLVSSSVFAQLQYRVEFKEEVDPKTLSEEQKKSRLFDGTMKAMEHFSAELGYEFADFKKKLDGKFEESFKLHKEQKLSERFGKGKESLSEEEKKSFLAGLESEKDLEFRKFSKALDIIQSYNSKASSEAESFKTIIELTLDRLKLNRLLKKITTDEKKAFSRLWIVPEMSLINLTWTDLGLEKEASFLNPLSGSWQKWVNENLPDSVEDVAVCEDECHKFFLEWEQKAVDQLATSVPADYQRALFAKVSLNLRRTHFNPTLNESVFEWDGKLLVLDVHTKRSVASYNLPPEKKDWRSLDQKALNSALASRLYRSPLPFFKQIEASLKGAQLNQVNRLVIRGHKNISDVLALMELMKARGSSLGMDVKLDKIRPNEAELLCFYQGEEKSFSDLLSKLKELKSSTGYQLVNEFTGVQHVLKLVHE